MPSGNGEKDGVNLDFLEPLDEGLGHSFCYVRPLIFDSPAITPSNSERYTVDSSTLDSETHSGSFRQEIAVEDLLQKPINTTKTETTFRTISGASVSANVTTARTGNLNLLLAADAAQEPSASFESTASFAAIPLQPVPRGSGPLNGFMSGPLERGFMSGPMDKGGAFLSGPLDNSTNASNYSAPLVYAHRRPGIRRLMRNISRPMKGWMQRFLMTQSAWHSKEEANHFHTAEAPLNCAESEPEYSSTRNLQWAHGKAGEDRVHVVLSEEQGWLFVGIYDGFSGPDAPDFLMSNLYKAIDKELEGLLWDYDEKPSKSTPSSGQLESVVGVAAANCVREGCGVPHLSGDRELLEKECAEDSQSQDNHIENQCEGVVPCKSNEDDIGKKHRVEPTLSGASLRHDEILEEKDEAKEIVHQLHLASEISHLHNPNLSDSSTGTSGHIDMIENEASNTPPKRRRKNRCLFELLQMERMEDTGTKESQLVAESSNMSSIDRQPSSTKGLCSQECLSAARLISSSVSTGGGSSSCIGEARGISESAGVLGEDSKDSNRKSVPSFSPSRHKQKMKMPLMGSKLRKMYRKQKSLRRKLFPWSYDWHRDKPHVEETILDPSVVIRRCKSGPVDHDAVLKAMSRALETTEEAYMEMVEKAIDINPELALMGSCVLVMLMKDQDVYVMNLGDSRVILAQDRLNDRHGNSSLTKDDAKHRSRSRESLVRVELDRISEESPMHNPKTGVFKINKNREISLCRLKMRAVQLSSDHSTSIEEEILRIKAEHADDYQAIMNDRVKGQLQVTRAFGAGFLKKPKFNEALLEMFRIDYIGASPYLSCIPYVLHHRLCSSDRFLVLSSDGLYQYFSNEEVISHVAWCMENVPEGDPAQYLIAELLFRAAKKNGMEFHDLLDIPRGDRRKYHDDVSVMVISLEGRIWRSSG